MNQSTTTRTFLWLGLTLLVSAAFLLWAGFDGQKENTSRPIQSLVLNESNDFGAPCEMNDCAILCTEKEERSTKCLKSQSGEIASKTKIRVDQRLVSTPKLHESSTKILPVNASLNVMIEQFRVNKKYKDGSPFYLISYDAFYPFVDGSFRGFSPEARLDSCRRGELSAQQINWLKCEGSEKIIAKALRRQYAVN